MSLTPEQFILDISSAVKNLVEDEVVLVVQKLSLDALRGVIEKSPVDTGRFRGNWNVGIGAQDLSTSENTDKDGGPTESKGGGLIDAVGPYVAIWVTNNLPYATALEFGHSTKGSHMVSRTFAELEATKL